jgi:hypothetical protein
VANINNVIFDQKDNNKVFLNWTISPELLLPSAKQLAQKG